MAPYAPAATAACTLAKNRACATLCTCLSRVASSAGTVRICAADSASGCAASSARVSSSASEGEFECDDEAGLEGRGGIGRGCEGEDNGELWGER